MTAQHRRIVLWLAIGTLLVLALITVFRPRPVLVDIAEARLGELSVTVSDEGKTRVHDIYVLSAPISGHLRRVEAEVGDPVVISDTIVARIQPLDAAFLDPRTEAQAKADVQAAQSALDLAKAEVNQAQAELDFAFAEHKRIRELIDKNSVSKSELDNAERQYKTRRAALATAQASMQMRHYELERAQAQLLAPAAKNEQQEPCECLNLTSPITGTVLKILTKSESVVQAGTPLMEIGNQKDLEIVVELLSFDAVKVVPGQKVFIRNWGGDKPLLGRVSHIEPIGYTKISALGIEEQRVNVIISFQSPFSDWARLGHGYQLDVDIVLWQQAEVLSVPLTALFREQQQWAIYKVADDRVHKQYVELGHKNHYHAQVISGLEAGEHYVQYPNNQIEQGVWVVARNTNNN